MDAAAYYRDVAEQFCQGDIFEDVPHLFLKERPKTPQQMMLGQKKAGALIDELCGLTPSPPLIGPAYPPTGTEVLVPVPALIGRAILLSHGCEIDKDRRHRVVALIRPMTSLTKPEEQSHIRSNGRKACFFMPSLGDQDPEGYIDFRRISTVTLEWLEHKKRIKALSEIARRQMLLRLFLFFSRLELDEKVFETGEAEEQRGD